MALSDFVLAGLTLMENTLGNPTFTWKDTTLACIPNSLIDTIKNSDKWFNENADFRMTVRTNQFNGGAMPQLNDYIYYLGYKLKVSSIKYTPHGIFNVYICSLPTSN